VERGAITARQKASLQIEMARRAVVTGVLGLLVFIVFYLATPFPRGRPVGSDAVLAVLVAAAFLRAAVYAVARVYLPDPAWLTRCRTLFRAVMMLSSIAWGLLAVSTIAVYGVSAQTFVVLCIALGIALLAIEGFGLDLFLVRIYNVLLIAPACVTLFAIHPEPAALAIGFGYSIYGLCLLFLSTRAHSMLWEALENRAIIQAKRDRLAAMLEAFPGVVVWIDDAGTILGMNDKLASAFDARPAALVGRQLDEALDDPHLCDAIRAFRERGSQEEILELELALPAGRHPVLLALKRYGQVGHEQVLVIGLDIEDRKRAEAERDQARASAYQSSQLAELGVMAAGLAHEINNPLQALSYGLGTLRHFLEEPATPRQQLAEQGLRIVERGERTVQRIASIVQTLGNFATTGERGELFARVDLCDVISELQELGGPMLRAQGVTFDVDVPKAPLIVCARRVQLGQVLLNLINNSRDAVEPLEDKTIRIAARERGAEIELTVEDSGKGIPAALRDRIMVPFFTTKRVGRGTGLGLSISKTIVEQHGGRLFLDTAADHTRFVIELPVGAGDGSSGREALHQPE
jgi:signal transduction histidine kinase